MKNLEKDYRAYKEIEARYDGAQNEEEKNTALAAVRGLNANIEAQGDDYANIYRAYKDARERGNENLDLNDAIWNEQVPAMIESLKENGIEKFTFSSTWSGAVQTAWIFTENGCKLEGMTQINGTNKDWKTGEYDKVPAYVFSLI